MNDRKKESSEALKKLNKAASDGIEKLSKENALLVISLFELNQALKNGGRTKDYDNLIDKKYWNDDALFYISTAIMCGIADTLEKAIAMYEDYKKPE